MRCEPAAGLRAFCFKVFLAVLRLGVRRIGGWEKESSRKVANAQRAEARQIWNGELRKSGSGIAVRLPPAHAAARKVALVPIRAITNSPEAREPPNASNLPQEARCSLNEITSRQIIRDPASRRTRSDGDAEVRSGGRAWRFAVSRFRKWRARWASFPVTREWRLRPSHVRGIARRA